MEQQYEILGAKKAVMALKAIEALAEISDNPETTWHQHYASEQSAIDELVKASGSDSDEMRGFLAAIGEYLHMVNSCGVPNLDVWKPAAAMTSEELADYRRAMEESD